MHYVSVVIRPKCPSHASANTFKTFNISGRWILYLSAIIIVSCLSLMRRFLSNCWAVSCSFAYWRWRSVGLWRATFMKSKDLLSFGSAEYASSLMWRTLEGRGLFVVTCCFSANVVTDFASLVTVLVIDARFAWWISDLAFALLGRTPIIIWLLRFYSVFTCSVLWLISVFTRTFRSLVAPAPRLEMCF